MSDINDLFLRRLEQLMQGRSYYWLSQQSGVADSVLSRIRAKKNEASLSTMEAIAKSFGLTVSEFLAAGSPETDIPLDLLAMMRGQTPETYNVIRAVVGQLVKTPEGR